MALFCAFLTWTASAQAESRDSIAGLAVQPDGKIIAAGLATSNSFGIARYLPSGSLDTTFSGDGKQMDAFGYKAVATSVALQPDGKIVVAGHVEDLETGVRSFAVARYTSEGALDPTFSGDGFAAIPLGPFCGGCVEYAFASSVVIQADGSIVVGGSANFRGTIIRLLSNGVLDPSFSDDGVLTFSDGNEGIAGVALQADGKIVAVGHGEPLTPPFFPIYVARLNGDGSFDTSFSGDGKVATTPGAVNGAGAIAVQPDGKIVVAGDSGDAYTNDYTAIRYLSDGALDTSFSGDGIATADIGGFDIANSIAIQADGDILLGGQQFGSFAVARFVSSGALDSSFGSTGIMTDHPEADGRAIALQADGRILVGGDTDCCLESTDFLLSRYEPTGSKDGSFGTGGDVTTDFSGGETPEEEGGESGGESGGQDSSPPGSITVPSAAPSDSEAPRSVRAGVAVAGGVAVAKHGGVLLRVRCAGRGSCHGVAKLFARLKPKGHSARRGREPRRASKRARNVLVGKSRFALPAGHHAVVRIKLNRRGKVLLGRAGKRGLQVRLAGAGIKNRTVRLKSAEDRRHNQKR